MKESALSNNLSGICPCFEHPAAINAKASNKFYCFMILIFSCCNKVCLICVRLGNNMFTNLSIKPLLGKVFCFAGKKMNCCELDIRFFFIFVLNIKQL